MTIMYGQCNNTIVTKLALRSSYATDCDNGNIINFLKEDGGKTWDDYCKIMAAAQLKWEGKADNQTKVILFLMNLKNKPAKKDLRLAFA